MTSLMEKQAEKWKTSPLIQQSNQSSLEEVRKEIMIVATDVAIMRANLKEEEERLEKLIKRKWKLEAEQLSVKVVKKGKRTFNEEEKELLNFLRKEAICMKQSKKETQEGGLS